MRPHQSYNACPSTGQTPRSIQNAAILDAYSASAYSDCLISCDGLPVTPDQHYLMGDSVSQSSSPYQHPHNPIYHPSLHWQTSPSPADHLLQMHDQYQSSISSPSCSDYHDKDDWSLSLDGRPKPELSYPPIMYSTENPSLLPPRMSLSPVYEASFPGVQDHMIVPSSTEFDAAHDFQAHQLLQRQHEARSSPSQSERSLYTPPQSHRAHHLTEPASADGRTSNTTPYARLIFQALKKAPNHLMSLQDLYQWFIDNTDKVKIGEKDGWKNSIRHNLSMNGAFEKASPTSVADETKKTSIWRLKAGVSEDDEIEPTTRYRKKDSDKKTTKSRSSQHRAAGAHHFSRTTRSKSKSFKSVHQPCSFTSRSYQHSYDYSRHPSTVPDDRHASPSTPTSFDVPTAGTFYSKSGLSPYMGDLTINMQNAEYTFGNIQGGWPDGSQMFMDVGNGLYSTPQWTDQFEC